MRLLFHSDDAGATANVTKKIMTAWEKGYLEGFSVIANGDAVQDIKHVLDSKPDRAARISAHLNLLEGSPLLPANEVPLLVSEQGQFNCSFIGLWIRWLLSGAEKRAEIVEQVRKEWAAQVQMICELCKPRQVAAVDSHMHLHMLPFLFPVAAGIAGEVGIPEIRLAHEPWFISGRAADSLRLGFAANIVKHLLLKSITPSARRTIAKTGLASPDAFIGLLYTSFMTKGAAHAGIEAAKRAGAKSVEVLFHIGRAAEEESSRWQAVPGIGRFYLDKGRDREAEELIATRELIE